jgi:hypothetical protein
LAVCEQGNWDEPWERKPENVGKIWQAECNDYSPRERAANVQKGGC